MVIIIIIRYIDLYTEPGIVATACGRELLYVYVYVYVFISSGRLKLETAHLVLHVLAI